MEIQSLSWSAQFSQRCFQIFSPIKLPTTIPAVSGDSLTASFAGQTVYTSAPDPCHLP